MICAGLTVYEIPNALFICRHSRTAIGDEKLLEDCMRAEAARIDKSAMADPEAADMLRYCLGDPNDVNLEDLVTKYPENEFFWGQLAKRLTEADLVDPRAALAVVDKLAAMNRGNAHYRYVRGLILLSEPGGPERDRLALEQFELGNDLGDFYLPYGKYKQRLELLCDSMHLSPISSRVGEFKDLSVYNLFNFEFMRWRGKSLVQFDRDLLYALAGEMSDIGARLTNHVSNDLVVESGMFTLLMLEPLRLQELDLSEVEAEQARLRLSQALAVMPLLRRTGADRDSLLEPLAVAALLATVALQVLPLLLIVWVFLVVVNRIRGCDVGASATIGAYIFFIAGLLGMFGLLILLATLEDHVTEGYFWGFLFIGLAVIVWGLLRLLSRIRAVDPARFRRSRKWAAAVCGPLWVLGVYSLFKEEYPHTSGSDFTEWLELFGNLLAWSALWTIIWAVAAHRHHVFRIIPYDRLLRTRFVRIPLVLTLMTGVTWSLKLAPAAAPIAVFFTILLLGLVACRASEDLAMFARVIRRFFQRDSDIVVTRSRMERMMTAVLLMSWLVVLAANHICADKLSKLNTLLMDPLSPYRPLPQATHQTYERVVLGTASGELTAQKFPDRTASSDENENLQFASPEDMSRIIATRQAAGKPLSDENLAGFLQDCGRDVRPIILDALQDPNAVKDSLRAQWGDKTVKERLERVFEERMAALPESGRDAMRFRRRQSPLESLLDLAGDLAQISDRQEAEAHMSRLLELVVKKAKAQPERPALFEEYTADTPQARLQARERYREYRESRGIVHSFWESLKKLPLPSARRLFKSYLQRTEFADLYTKSDFDEFASLIEMMADRDVAEQIFLKVAETSPIEDTYDIPIGNAISVSDGPLPLLHKDAGHKFLEALFPHLNSESIPLLLEHLDSDNDRLRAFIVWRVTSLGYEWPGDQLQGLLKDDYWKVRLNSLFALDKDNLAKALDDENAVVRIVARMHFYN